MPFNFDLIQKFDYFKVIKFATIDLVKQKGIVGKIAYLMLLFIIVFLLAIVFFVGISAGAVLLLVPSMSEFVIFTPLLFIASLISFVLMVLIIAYLNYYIIAFALTSAKKKVQTFSWYLALKILVTQVLVSFAALLSIYDLKILVVGIVGAIIALLGLAFVFLSKSNPSLISLGILFILFSLIPLIIYYVFVVRNAIRLSFAQILVAEKDLGVFNSMRQSWGISAGKAVLIFIVQLILGAILWIIQQIIYLPINIAAFPMQFMMLVDIVSFVFMIIPFMIVLFLLAAFISAISGLITVFGTTAIYTQIKK